MADFFLGGFLGRRSKLVSVGESERDTNREKDAVRCVFSNLKTSSKLI